MHEINLEDFSLRTDVIIDFLEDKITYSNSDLIVDEIYIDSKKAKNLKIKEGYYTTITFDDITDKDNMKKIEEALIKSLKNMLDKLNIQEEASALIIGLGNSLSTPDSLGSRVVDNILVTKYLFELGEVEEGYRNTAKFKPGVTGVTGIETSDLIEGIIKKAKPDFLIVIDSLKSRSINRINKTIQMTSTGISPGSGIGNNRKEISYKTYKIPVISIGVPTIVDFVTIVYDSLKFLQKKLCYKIETINNDKNKLIPYKNENYLEGDRYLTDEEKQKFLGMIGTLNDEEIKSLLDEVLTPINRNLMVTPTEIDYQIEKLSEVISRSINKALHKSYNPTK